MADFAGYLAQLARIGGPVVALVGGLIYYYDRRAHEDHEAEQSRLDRMDARITDLQDRVAEMRDDLIAQADKIRSLQEELAEAERTVAQKDGRIERLQAKVDVLQQQVARLREGSDPALAASGDTMDAEAGGLT